MKFRTFADTVLVSVALVISISFCTPVHAKDTGAEAVTEAYFFALEHGNYEGAFSLYSDKFKARYKNARTWESSIKENMPQIAEHEARQVMNSTVKNGTTIVKVMVVGQDMEVWAFALNLRIEGGLWKIIGGVAMRVGTAKPAM